MTKSSLRSTIAARRTAQDGFSILELIIVLTILSILTTAVVPLVRNSVKRERESDLRLALRQLRKAIDDYKHFNDLSGGAAIPIELRTPTGYPKELKTLVEGFIPANVVGTSQNRIRFLRRIPVDPMTGDTEWGMRSYKDKPDATDWGGDDIFDVFSKSDGKALNGTQYKNW
jgi:general secretion pathway protein G